LLGLARRRICGRSFSRGPFVDLNTEIVVAVDHFLPLPDFFWTVRLLAWHGDGFLGGKKKEDRKSLLFKAMPYPDSVIMRRRGAKEFLIDETTPSFTRCSNRGSCLTKTTIYWGCDLIVLYDKSHDQSISGEINVVPTHERQEWILQVKIDSWQQIASDEE
jgi:hypothetical protein